LTKSYYIDYTSYTSLVSAIQGVKNVIALFKIPGLEWVKYQLNLLKEAGVKRSAPAEHENGPVAVWRWMCLWGSQRYERHAWDEEPA